MPTIYRSMKEDSGTPALGNSATCLGIRVPKDIEPDAEENVQPGVHGMSVSPSPEKLPLMFIPRRLKDRFPQAVGNDNLRIWKMGKGDWASEVLTPGLRLELDPSKPDQHGLVGPDAEMSLNEYRAALASTQASWSLAEEPPAQ